MGEFKRVFLDAKKMLLLLAAAVLSVIMLIADTVGTVAPNVISNTFAAARYRAELTEELKGLSFDEIISVCNKKQETLLEAVDFDFSPEAVKSAKELLADIPYLVSCIDDKDNYWRAESRFYKCISDICSEAEYLSGYHAGIEKVLKSAEKQGKVGIFNQSNGFTSKNISKTAEDYEQLLNVDVSFGNGFGVEQWIGLKSSDYIFLVIIAVLILDFLSERKKGLWNVVRACKGGRARLGLTRLCILAAESALSTVLIYGSTLIASFIINGGANDLNRAAQSVECFGSFTGTATVKDIIIRVLILKAASGVLVGLILWTILGIVSNPNFSFLVLGVFLAAEYLLYELLPQKSVLGILKYVNVFSYVHSSSLYSGYLNINFFGLPVEYRPLMLRLLPALAAIFAASAILIQSHRRPEGNRDILSSVSHFFNRAADLLRTRIGLGGWEVYKTLVFEFVIVFFVGVAILCRPLDYTVRSGGTDIWYQEFLTDMQGKLDESSDEYFARARESAQGNMNEFAVNMALDKLEQDVDEIKLRAEAKGYDPWLVDPQVYSTTYGPDASDYQRYNAALAIVFTALCSASVAVFERQIGVTQMLRSLRYGRKKLFSKKVLTVLLIAVFVWAEIYMRELSFFLNVMDPTTMSACVQNISELTDFPIKISFSGYLILLYAIRLAMLSGVAFMSLSISMYSNDLKISYLLNALLLGVPSFICILGTDAFKYLSPMIPVSSAELLWKIGAADYTALLPWVVWAAISISALLLARRKWVKT